MDEKSCGVVPFKKTDEGLLYLIVQHVEELSGHVDFPKGHMDAGETEEETAVRETKEEVGTSVEIIPGYRETIEFCPKEGVCKEVVFFVGRIVDTDGKICDDHVASCEMLGFEQAMEKLTYQTAKDLLKKANEFLKNFK